MTIKKINIVFVICFLIQVFYSAVVFSEDMSIPMDVDIGGFIRGDIGFGDRYTEAAGEDRIGVSKAALVTVAKSGDVKGVFVIGTEVTSELLGTTNGNVDIKDAFIVWGDDKLNFSLGAQPLLFGLKPEGYPGDHSIQASVEYGAGGAFAVSNQAGPSAIVNWSYNEDNSLRAGVFDSKSYAPAGFLQDAEDGSSLVDNVVLQWRSSNIASSGVYAVIGLESVYVGGNVNDTGNVSTLGVGWKNSQIDLSFEYFALDDIVQGTVEDEQFLVIEAMYIADEKWKLYLDYSEADILEIETVRLGLNYDYSHNLMLSAEMAQDDVAGESVDSFDFRLTLSY